MNSSVYIETSIVSYLTGRPSRDVIVAGRQALTREWWDNCREKFDLYVSPLVVTEAEDGDADAAQRRLDVIKGVPALAVADETEVLARQLVVEGPMPEEYPEDALHVALCALNAIDYLLTWNCTHLANAVLRRDVERFLDRSGCVCPTICTPEELMET